MGLHVEAQCIHIIISVVPNLQFKVQIGWNLSRALSIIVFVLQICRMNNVVFRVVYCDVSQIFWSWYKSSLKIIGCKKLTALFINILWCLKSFHFIFLEFFFYFQVDNPWKSPNFISFQHLKTLHSGVFFKRKQQKYCWCF